MRFLARLNKTNTIWPFTLLLGIIFLIVGVNDGQLEEIYHKAVMICLECIGIG